MAEYIEQEALLHSIEEIRAKHGLAEDEEMEFTELDIAGLISCLPTAEVEPVRPGQWLDRYGGKYENALYQCSECKTTALYKPESGTLGNLRFVQKRSERCPHCGADMRGADNEN